MPIRLFGLAVLGLVSCGIRKLPTAPPKADCPLSFDSLAGTEWLFLRHNHDQSQTPDVGTRMRFSAVGGTLEARYSMGSLADMYDYDCSLNGEELTCLTPLLVDDVCMAAAAAGVACSDELLLGQEPSLSVERMDAARAAAQAALETSDEAQFRLSNNNLGRKHRAALYVRIDEARCRLHVTDMYRVLYQGRWIEDSNPVGTSPFVPNDQGPLLWEHCGNYELVASGDEGFPEVTSSVASVREHPVGQPVYYRLLDDDWLRAEEDCAYRYDVWHGGRLAEEGRRPEVVSGTLRWQFARTHAQASGPGQAQVSVIQARRECGGQAAEQVVSCTAVTIVP